MKHRSLLFSANFWLLLITLHFSGCYLMCNKKADNPETNADTTQTTTTEDKGERTSENSGGKPVSNGSFSFTPPQPQAGKLKGVVELGAAGFNSFIVTVDANKAWKLEKAEYGQSLVYEKMATEEDIKSGLKKYIAAMFDFGVKSSDIQFVVSSGASKDEKVQKIIAALKSMKYVVNVVTPEQEGKLAAKCVLPTEFASNSFVVDIGSGNTKITWEENGIQKAFETYGAKYYDRNVADEQVYKEVMSIVAKIPESRRTKCFIIGGAPYEFAKQVRKDKERYVVLAKPADYKAEGAKQKSGLNIYKAIAEGSQCETFVFDFDSNFTIGYLLSLKY